MLRSKQGKIERYNKDIARSKKKQSDLMKSLSKHQRDLAKEQQSLTKLQTDEQNKMNKLQTNLINKQQNTIESLREEASVSKTISSETKASKTKKYDFFLSHASEDKSEIAEPLAKKLMERNTTVWLDKFELRIGDSLRKSIDSGLASSRYGIVILTETYMKKFWTEIELNALFAKWAGGDNKVILPIWHNISKDDVLSYSPMLGDILALSTSMMTLEEIADELAALVNL